MRIPAILLSIILISSTSGTKAQALTEKQRALELLRSVAGRYRDEKGLHFTMQYRYASEDKPGAWLDSLKGDFNISGDRFHYSLDSTEFIGGKDMAVVLYKQDQVMYLTNGTAALQKANPMALLDSMLVKDDSLEYRIRETKDWQTIIISFHPVRTTRRIEYTIDKHTGYVTRMISVVDARELYDPSVKHKVENGTVYAIVETDLTGYRQVDPGGKEWDLTRLFRKEGKEYIPLPPYESYKIFLGTPDL